ncbi:MAG: acetyltransferase [Chromatiales bacterium]|nr:acetyltransferase [Chromatiales bacterium]
MLNALEIAETVRAAGVDAAARSYEEAGISGLCHEGRWENALQAVRTPDRAAIVTAARAAARAAHGNDPGRRGSR